MLRSSQIFGRRAVHTRAKKVKIQLLKNFPGVGYKGEVLEVSEGYMRNKLHRGNGAAYVLPNEPLRVPFRARTEPPPVEAVEEKEVVQTSEKIEEVDDSDKKQSLLDLLRFPGEPTNDKDASQSTQSSESTSASTISDAASNQPSKAGAEGVNFDWQNEFVAKATNTKVNNKTQ